MGRLLIIGCGGVAGVAIHKCCQNSKTFSEICIASRTKAKCDALKEKLENTTETKITTAQVDADKVEELIALIQSYQPDAVLNVALPYRLHLRRPRRCSHQHELCQEKSRLFLLCEKFLLY